MADPFLPWVLGSIWTYMTPRRDGKPRAKAVPREKATPEQIWILSLSTRLPFGKLLVAIANKHARQLWAMLARGEHYDPDAWLKHPMTQRAPSKRSAATLINAIAPPGTTKQTRFHRQSEAVATGRTHLERT